MTILFSHLQLNCILSCKNYLDNNKALGHLIWSFLGKYNNLQKTNWIPYLFHSLNKNWLHLLFVFRNSGRTSFSYCDTSSMWRIVCKPLTLMMHVGIPWCLSYCFCRERFSFAVSDLLSPWAIFFCRERFAFAVTVMDHRMLVILKELFQTTAIIYLTIM